MEYVKRCGPQQPVDWALGHIAYNRNDKKKHIILVSLPGDVTRHNSDETGCQESSTRVPHFTGQQEGSNGGEATMEGERGIKKDIDTGSQGWHCHCNIFSMRGKFHCRFNFTMFAGPPTA